MKYFSEINERKRRGVLYKVKWVVIALILFGVISGGCSLNKIGDNVSSVENSGNIFNYFLNELGHINETLKGRSYYIRTFADSGKVIDSIKGASVYIKLDDKFNQTNSNGEVIKKSSVIDLTIGGISMTHVGSSLVAYEDGLVDVFDEYAKTHSIINDDRSTPIVNSIMNDLKNFGKGKKKVVLIRSQAGEPIATFVGDSVSYFSTEIGDTTSVLIDGKSVFIYRCDYTIYDVDLLD